VMDAALRTCSVCSEAKHTSGPLCGYYASNLSKCKECIKTAVKLRYRENHEAMSLYERERNQRPERRAQAIKTQKRRRDREPQRYIARTAVGNALRDGRLKRLPCERCGATVGVEAHHDDYSKPLDVIWLCFPHHRERHGQLVEMGLWRTNARVEVEE